MNAYELADGIEDDYWDSRANKIMLESAKMLRQQADRIETLQTMLAEYTALMMQQKHHIVELEKDLLKYDRLAWDDLNKQSSEPYCWRMKANDPNDKDWWLFGRNPNRDEKVSHSAIPLYTKPQIKELSDEEIRVFMAEMPHLTERKDLLMFARAILKKASEK